MRSIYTAGASSKIPGSKGQAGMEFLLTYGWAILVVLVAISALAYFGMFDSKFVWKVLPKKCDLPPEIHCSNFELYYDDTTLPPSNTLKIYVKNNRGFRIQINRVKIANIDTSSISIPLQNGESSAIEIPEITPLNGNTAAISAGEAYRIEFTIQYRNLETQLDHTSSVTLRGPEVIKR